MSRQSTSTALGLIAGSVFLAGIIASTYSLTGYPTIKRQYDKDIASIKILDDLEQKFNELELQSAPLAKLNYSNLPDPKSLTKSVFGADKIENIQQDKKLCATDYAINHIEISLKDVSLEKLPAFIRSMESLRPPIRLTSCKIRASTTTSGNGNLKLKLERIECP